MFICNCNGLRESAVRAAHEAGARRAADVYRHHGCAMQCGRCCAEIKQCLRELQTEVLQESIAPLQTVCA